MMIKKYFFFFLFLPFSGVFSGNGLASGNEILCTTYENDSVKNSTIQVNDKDLQEAEQKTISLLEMPDFQQYMADESFQNKIYFFLEKNEHSQLQAFVEIRRLIKDSNKRSSYKEAFKNFCEKCPEDERARHTETHNSLMETEADLKANSLFLIRLYSEKTSKPLTEILLNIFKKTYISFLEDFYLSVLFPEKEFSSVGSIQSFEKKMEEVDTALIRAFLYHTGKSVMPGAPDLWPQFEAFAHNFKLRNRLIKLAKMHPDRSDDLMTRVAQFCRSQALYFIHVLQQNKWTLKDFDVVIPQAQEKIDSFRGKYSLEEKALPIQFSSFLKTHCENPEDTEKKGIYFYQQESFDDLIERLNSMKRDILDVNEGIKLKNEALKSFLRSSFHFEENVEAETSQNKDVIPMQTGASPEEKTQMTAEVPLNTQQQDIESLLIFVFKSFEKFRDFSMCNGLSILESKSSHEKKTASSYTNYLKPQGHPLQSNNESFYLMIRFLNMQIFIIESLSTFLKQEYNERHYQALSDLCRRSRSKAHSPDLLTLANETKSVLGENIALNLKILDIYSEVKEDFSDFLERNKKIFRKSLL